MAEILMIVDTALSEVPVNKVPLIDDTDFKTIETSVAYNASGMALKWNFVTTGGSMTQTAVTPTTGGDYDWASQGNGIYSIEIPASGGASINNDTEGFGWFTGVADGVLPWAGPIIQFSPANVVNSVVNGSDLLDVNASQLGGTSQTGRDIGASVLLSSGTGTGQISLSSGTVTAGSVSDKTGYSLSAGGVTAVQSGLATSAAQTTAQNDLDTITGSDGVTLATLQGNYAPAKAGDEMDIVDSPNATGVAAIQSGLATSTAQSTAQADLDILTGSDGATLATSQPNYAPAVAGDQMDLVDAPNPTAVTAIQNGLSTFDNTTDEVSADVVKVNGIAVTGSGTDVDPWGPV